MEIKLFILVIMILLHIITDFNIQNDIIANFKQKEYWKKNCPDKMYKYDYIIVLFIHGFSWSIVVSLPLFVYYFYIHESIQIIFMLIIAHGILHAFIDHLKANEKVINLVQDQIFHLEQVISMWCIIGGKL